MRQRDRSRVEGAALAAVFAIAVACGDSTERPSPSSPASSSSPGEAGARPEPKEPEASSEKLAKRGRSLYMSNCIACHNHDPAEPGALGPAVAHSSLELIEAKVIRNEYPADYTPKRDSNAMVPLSYLAKEIPALHAFLSP